MNGPFFSVIFIKDTAAPRAVAGRGDARATYTNSRALTSALADGVEGVVLKGEVGGT